MLLTTKQQEEMINVLKENADTSIQESNNELRLEVSKNESYEFGLDGSVKRVLGESGVYNEQVIVPGGEEILTQLKNDSETSMSRRIDDSSLAKVIWKNNKLSVVILDSYGQEIDNLNGYIAHHWADVESTVNSIIEEL